MRRIGLELLAPALLAGTIGCNGGSSSPTPTSPTPVVPADRLELVSVSPANGGTLPGDQTTVVHATLRYELETAATGRIGVTVVCSRSGTLTCVDAGNIADLADAHGETSVSVPLRPPSGFDVTVQFDLIPAGATSSTARVVLHYHASG